MNMIKENNSEELKKILEENLLNKENINNNSITLINIKDYEELQEKINKTIRYINLLEDAFIERDIEIDYILLDTARQLLEDNIEIPDVTIKYLRGDK